MKAEAIEIVAARRCPDCPHFLIDHDPNCVKCGCDRNGEREVSECRTK